VKLVISDAHEGLKAAISKILSATWQRCRVGLLKNLTITDSLAFGLVSGGQDDRTAEPGSAQVFRLRLAA
jgi:hypothetical protein